MTEVGVSESVKAISIGHPRLGKPMLYQLSYARAVVQMA